LLLLLSTKSKNQDSNQKGSKAQWAWGHVLVKFLPLPFVRVWLSLTDSNQINRKIFRLTRRLRTLFFGNFRCSDATPCYKAASLLSVYLLDHVGCRRTL